MAKAVAVAAPGSGDELANEMLAFLGENDADATVDAWLDTGYPPLNYALSNSWTGGLPVGRITEIFGPSSSGKTAIATMAMISAQRAGGVAAFADHEHSFSSTLARQLGLDVTPGHWIYKKPRTFEESLDKCIGAAKLIRGKKLIDPKAPICWVFDSLATMVPQSKLIDDKGHDRELSSQTMHDNLARAKATSGSFDVFNLFVEELDIAAIFLNQLRLKPNVRYGNPETTPGGEAPKFYASVRIQLGATPVVIEHSKTDREVIGSEITARVIKNKITRPFRIAKFRFMFQKDGTGKFDVIRSMIEFLIEEKQLVPAGTWLSFAGGKYQSKEKLAKAIEDGGQPMLDELMKLLPEAYQPPVVSVVLADEPGNGGAVIEA